MDLENLISLNREEIVLNSDGISSRIAILKVGTIHDRGLKITEEMLDDFIKNFEKGIYGTEIQVNLGHFREGEAAGWIKGLSKQDGVLFADVEWTPLGIDKVSSKQFRYTSSELSLSYTHPDTGSKVKNVLIGVALTNIPAVKGMQPITLSENIQLFFNSNQMNENAKKKYSELMGKDFITEKEMSEFSDICGDGEEAMAAKKKLADKVKKEKKTEKMDENDKAENNKNTISLSEFNAEKERNIKLQERIDRMELSEVVEKNYLLSSTVKLGFAPTHKDKVVSFLMGLTPDQREDFSEIFKLAETVDLSTIGSGKTEEAKSEDAAIKNAEKEALELSQKSGRPYDECLSEKYRELEEAKK